MATNSAPEASAATTHGTAAHLPSAGTCARSTRPNDRAYSSGSATGVPTNSAADSANSGAPSSTTSSAAPSDDTTARKKLPSHSKRKNPSTSATAAGSA